MEANVFLGKKVKLGSIKIDFEVSGVIRGHCFEPDNAYERILEENGSGILVYAVEYYYSDIHHEQRGRRILIKEYPRKEIDQFAKDFGLKIKGRGGKK